MTFEEALAAMKEGKIVTDGFREFRIYMTIEHRLIGNSSWRDKAEFSFENMLGDHWQIVEGKE